MLLGVSGIKGFVLVSSTWSSGYRALWSPLDGNPFPLILNTSNRLKALLHTGCLFSVVAGVYYYGEVII